MKTKTFTEQVTRGDILPELTNPKNKLLKRRTFLKTVGSAAGATALGAVSGTGGPGPATGGRPTLTMSLEEVTAGGPGSTAANSTLRIRPPFWHPDGSPPGGTPADPKGRRQLFQEEIVGEVDHHKMRSLPVEFEYKGVSKKWILGGAIAETAPLGHEQFTALVRALAVKVRKYNASLYRLRRIHYCNRFDPTKHYWPHPNPDGGDEKDPTAGDVPKRVSDAEKDWCTVTDDLDSFLERAKTGYPNNPNDPNDPNIKRVIKLVGLDMTAVNSYVIAMRVVVESIVAAPPEVCGSSSQVSISSPFSSSSP